MTDSLPIKALIEKAVFKAVSGASSDYSVFPLADTRNVARLFNVSVWTVRAWAKQGLLEANYQLLSGRVVKLVFTNRALCKFFDENFPSAADLAMTDFHPKSSRAQRIKRLLTMKKLYTRRRRPKL
jgi:hypothetical protein